MKIIIVVALALVAAASALPLSEPVHAAAKLLRSEFQQAPEGPYSLSFESDDGVSRQEQGELKEVLDEDKKPHTVVVIRGTYSFPNSDGKPISVSYFADETGYHAEGDSIPKAL